MSFPNEAQETADLIKGRRRAERMLNAALADYEAECGQPSDDVWYDLVIATAHIILIENPEDTDVAREFCRTQVGHVPMDLEPWLGKKD